jgi:hypothetical protein
VSIEFLPTALIVVISPGNGVFTAGAFAGLGLKLAFAARS